ncbi:HAMP domain-containing sensor histidine kinase [Bacillus tuaregi]|uniref:HAMP domain-containing sensor histidine kinase n=1 Tax=Bacillus tuaregi TaxID=1816695 RepID=UPI0008F90DDC|nr:HAMP domain-containing sensor histidine kinase [Bacillus tuaregi]
MKKLSVKLGILFFVVIFGLITFMFFFLHAEIVDSRIEQELQTLKSRGNSHKAILEKQFDDEMVDHVVLMESESNTDVIITNESGEILDSSAPVENFRRYIEAPLTPIPNDGQVLEEKWEQEPYIATVSPIQIDQKVSGYVYMFQDTALVRILIHSLNEHFLIAGLISVIFTIIIICFLSRGITRPLIKMKEATSQISKGNFSVPLPHTSEDELGDLAKSIKLLATDLNYLKKERSQFLASISHELRTPLTYIKGYADIVKKRNLSKEEQGKYLSIIVEESDRLAKLIKELFELAKIDQNTFIIEKELINLNEFFTKMDQKFSPIFHENEMKFTINCQPNLLLKADSLRLEQIFMNLLDNAMKYSNRGSTVSLTAWKQKKEIYISIKDNGRGIPEEDLPYIFHRFYRVDKSRTRSLGGTGLGLAIIKELILAHGGDIQVRSKENVGTTFELIFKEDQN